jgi:hypothetical protein
VTFRRDLHSGVVGISADDIFGVRLVGVLDHAEQAVLLADTINGPRSIENVVSAVLRVDLGKHEELNIVLPKSVLVFKSGL